jgi:hypothetical protein
MEFDKPRDEGDVGEDTARLLPRVVSFLSAVRALLEISMGTNKAAARTYAAIIENGLDAA